MTEEIIRMIEDARKLSDAEWEERKKHLLKEAEKFAIEKRVANLLIEVGIPENMIGYKDIKKAIMIYMQYPKLISEHKVRPALYEMVADELSTTKQITDSRIRRSIAKAFKSGNQEKLEEIFGWTYSITKAKATNAEFIVKIAEYIKQTAKET